MEWIEELLDVLHDIDVIAMAWMRRFAVGVAIILIVALALWLTSQSNLHPSQWGWTGLGPYVVAKNPKNDVQRYKTLWDWLQLLVIPVVLAVAGYRFNSAQQRRANERADELERRADERAHNKEQETILQTYLDQMKDLLLHENLLEPHNEKVRRVARVQTSTTLRRLDKQRNKIVVGFLYGSRLIDKDDTIVGLVDVNLRKADLTMTDLHGANLTGALLMEANLSSAILRGAKLGWHQQGTAEHYFIARTNLQKAVLRNTDLTGADLDLCYLGDADLSDADLSDANLSGADLHGAKLNRTKLIGANLTTANLSRGHLRHAVLWKAILTSTNLKETDLKDASLAGADLSKANLCKADLRRADLGEAIVTPDQLAQAKSLMHAILPDGRRVSRVQWIKFRLSRRKRKL